MKIHFSKGVKLMLTASFFFAWMNVVVKFAPRIPVAEVIFFRAIVTLIISYLIIRRKDLYPWGVNKPFLIARGIFGAFGLFFYFYTLQKMELANAIVIHYLSPIFTTIIALLFLKEKIRGVQWLFFSISFLGVLMVKGFGEVNTFDFMMGVAGALFTGFAYNAIRNMRGKESADVIIFYHPLVTLPLSLIYFAFFPDDFIIPNGIEWIFLILTGVFTQLGQYFITRAYQADTAARISSVTYVGIIWGVLLGKFLFNDQYNILVLFGMITVLSGVVLNLNASKISHSLEKIFRKVRM